MAKKVATLIEKLAREAGIKGDDPRLIEALAITATIHDSIFDAIENNPAAITLENARNHPDLLKHFNAKIFNGMDAKIYALAEENGFDDDSMSELKAEKNSYAKLAMLNKKLADTFATKYKTPADKQALMDEISKLNKDILTVRTSGNKAIDAAKAEAEKEITEYAINSYLSTLPYANDDIPLDVNVMTARTLLSKHLGEKKARIKREDKELKIYNAEEDVPLLENNKPISFSDLSKQVLANNKLLKVSGQQGARQVVKTPQQTTGVKGPKMDNVLNHYDKQLAELGAVTDR